MTSAMPPHAFSLLTLSPAFANDRQAEAKLTPLDYSRLLPAEMFWESSEGKMIISHDGFQLLARLFGVEVDDSHTNIASVNPLMIAIMVQVKGYAPIHPRLDEHYMKPDIKTPNYGEASMANLTTDISKRYPVALAWKRAFDRAVKDHLGLYGIYSEEESDAFRRKPDTNGHHESNGQPTHNGKGSMKTGPKPEPTAQPTDKVQSPAPVAKPSATPNVTPPAAPVPSQTQPGQSAAPAVASEATAAVASPSGTPSPGRTEGSPKTAQAVPSTSQGPQSGSASANRAPLTKSTGATKPPTSTPVNKPGVGKPAPQPSQSAKNLVAGAQPAPETTAPSEQPSAAPQSHPVAQVQPKPAPVQAAQVTQGPASPLAPLLENPRLAKVLNSIPRDMPKPDATKPAEPYFEVMTSGGKHLSGGVTAETLEVIWSLASQIGVEKSKSIMIGHFPFVSTSPDMNEEQGRYVVLKLVECLEQSLTQKPS